MTKPDLGVDGRLLDANVVDRDIPMKNNAGPDQCSSGMDDGVRPATFYWQAARLCEGCASGYETSAVRSFVVHADLHLGLTVPKRAYRGYPVIASVRAGGVPDGGTSHPRTVKVVAARNWTTTHDAGAYKGKHTKLSVAAGGHTLRNFSATVSMFCVGPTIPDNHVMIGVAPVKRAKIAPDGRFYSRTKHGHSTVIELSGRVRHGRVKGSVELTVGTCDGTEAFSLKR